jgi:hypothetical protein
MIVAGSQGESHEEIPPMNLMSRVAILAISAVPMYAQAQQSGVVKLKADAQNVVKIISGDKLKTQTYCEIVELSDQIDEEQGSSKAEELSQKVDKLVEKLGPEYIALVSGLKDIDPNSRDAQEIGSILDPLDDLCGD